MAQFTNDRLELPLAADGEPTLMSNPTSPATSNSPSSLPFVDRRNSRGGGSVGVERRQFANSHDELSPEARELAVAIDEYKLRHRRRFITFEEMLGVVKELGYEKRTGE